jgi:hypothetical protein
MQTISTEPVLRSLHLATCVIALASAVEAASPALSVSLVPPASLQVSWSTNFAIGRWQLMYTTNLLAANWQPVQQTPILAGDALSALIPLPIPAAIISSSQLAEAEDARFRRRRR